MKNEYRKHRNEIIWDETTLQEMKHLYEEEHLSLTEIGKIFNINKITVNKHLAKFGVKIRNAGETKRLQIKKKGGRKPPKARGGFPFVHSKKLPAETIRLITSKYEEDGQNLVSLSDLFNLSTYVIKKVLLAAGVALKTASGASSKRKIFSEADEREIIRLYNIGVGACKLGKMFKTDYKKIKAVLTKNNIFIRDTNGDWGHILTEEEEKEICELYNNGIIGQRRMQDKFNISTLRVKEILSKHNIKIRNWKESITPEFSKNRKLNKSVVRRGYSGKYKNFNFDSINELSFILKLERKGIDFRSGESYDYCILYTDSKNKDRRYYPDFIINNKIIIEIKPKRHWKSPDIQAKYVAAKLFANQHGLIYKMIDPKPDLALISKAFYDELINFNEHTIKRTGFNKFVNKLSKFQPRISP